MSLSLLLFSGRWRWTCAVGGAFRCVIRHGFAGQFDRLCRRLIVGKSEAARKNSFAVVGGIGPGRVAVINGAS